MRYFIRLSYKGTAYSGWQRQINALGIQQLIEDTFSMVLQRDIRLTGCGRTDAGVHAKNYIAHLDLDKEWPEHFLYKINRLLPVDIAIEEIIPVPQNAHARFDANSRSYVYHLHAQKNPFRTGLSTYYPRLARMQVETLRDMAELYRSYGAFFPFCKTGSSVTDMGCDIRKCHWEIDPEEDAWTFHIRANRFLRGMVRMMVGMCLKVGEGNENIETVRDALDRQVRLAKSYSAPPQGLYFTGASYPFFQRDRK